MKSIKEFEDIFSNLEHFVPTKPIRVCGVNFPAYLNVLNGSVVYPYAVDVAPIFAAAKPEFKEGIYVQWSPNRGAEARSVYSVLKGDALAKYLKVMKVQSSQLKM